MVLIEKSLKGWKGVMRDAYDNFITVSFARSLFCRPGKRSLKRVSSCVREFVGLIPGSGTHSFTSCQLLMKG